MDNKVKISVVQRAPIVGFENMKKNMNESMNLAHKAIKQDAELIVFPELNQTGYVFENRKEAFSHAQPIDGEIINQWIEFCKEQGVYIADSFVEKDGANLYDTAVLIGPKGYIGKYRKTHLWNNEKHYFTPGDLGYQVFETPIGKIGLLICWDTWFPETFRILALQGADIICTLNNWVYTPGPLFDELGRCMAVYHTMSAAQVNGVFIAASNRIGTERGAKFLGNSVIVGPNGWPIQNGDIDSEMIIAAELNLSDSRKKHWTELNDIHGDRRKDLYDEMLGYLKK